VRALLVILWAVIASSDIIGGEAKLTEEAVLAAIAKSDEAREKNDLRAKVAVLADDFTLTSKWSDGTVRSRMTLPEYKAFLMERYKRSVNSKYAHKHGKVAVVVTPDGQTATARYETFQHDEDPQKGKLDWTNLEIDTFVLIDGKLLLKSVETILQGRHQSPP
jgi:hypothetical protein